MILITGGAGYIGSHTSVELLRAGYDIVIADNFSNSKPVVLDKIRSLGGRDFAFRECDLRCGKQTAALFDDYPIDAVIHFAALKAVGESVEIPLAYYDNNLRSTLNLLSEMERHGICDFVFSSSATVYGAAETVPLREDAPLSTASPYGSTKLMIETILTDVQRARPEMNVAILRYFNPIGSDSSGELGEDPNGIPNNLVPYIARVAIGRLDHLSVFGDDYDTPDGTCIRDYIHVTDLALGHIAALRRLKEQPGLVVYNLGTGRGSSVLDVVRAYSRAVGRDIPYVIAPRRAGDVPRCYADPAKAERELGWRALRGLDEMCRDSWNFQKKYPNGYESEEK